MQCRTQIIIIIIIICFDELCLNILEGFFFFKSIFFGIVLFFLIKFTLVAIGKVFRYCCRQLWLNILLYPPVGWHHGHNPGSWEGGRESNRCYSSTLPPRCNGNAWPGEQPAWAAWDSWAWRSSCCLSQVLCRPAGEVKRRWHQVEQAMAFARRQSPRESGSPLW